MAAYEIVKVVELSGMPNAPLARDMLERLRAATRSVVAKHKWRVPVLKEFYPKNPGLLGLNVNRGQSIMIRLREGSDQFSFLPWHSVLGTLVHELTHNDVGEHSAEFYKKMEELYDEVEASSSGLGSGALWGLPAPKYNFDGAAAKLGGGSLAKSVGVGKDNIRRLAAEAALRRNSADSNTISAGARVLGSGGSSDCGWRIPATSKERKEMFMRSEEKRRQEGCSVKGPQENTIEKSSNSSSSSNKSNSDNRNDIVSIKPNQQPIVFPDMWLCQVCLEKNKTNSSCCAWCGCVIGSMLEGSSERDPQFIPVCGDVPTHEFLFSGLCRNTLFELRNCSCCGKNLKSDFTQSVAPSLVDGFTDGNFQNGPCVSLLCADSQQIGKPTASSAKTDTLIHTSPPTRKRRRVDREASKRGCSIPEQCAIISLLD